MRSKVFKSEPTEVVKEWIDEFDNRLWQNYNGSFEAQRRDIKSFIKDLLAKQKEKVVEELREKIEKMLKVHLNKKEG